jgi:hypothetical protein
MRYVKTFEEMWPFKKETEADKNKKSLISICKYLLDNCKTILQYKVKRVEVGYSTKRESIFIIQFFTDVDIVIRYLWRVNDDFKIIEFDSYYLVVDEKVKLHSVKHKMDRTNIESYLELDRLVKLMNKFFTDNKLI